VKIVVGMGCRVVHRLRRLECLFHLVFALICRICHEDHCGSRLLSGSCATIVGSIFDERRGKVVVVRAVV
jgi:hypothetical protein